MPGTEYGVALWDTVAHASDWWRDGQGALRRFATYAEAEAAILAEGEGTSRQPIRRTFGGGRYMFPAPLPLHDKDK